MVRVAIAQLAVEVRSDPGEARQQVVDTVRTALDAGAQLVVLPELAVPGYTTDADVVARLAEGIPGPTTDALCELTAGKPAVVVCGLAEKDDGHLFNSAVVITDGVVAGLYRKLHLFDREKTTFTPGDRGLPVVHTAVGAIGLCICYDLRFPEVSRVLALRGAEIICAPAAWVDGFDAPRVGLPSQLQNVAVQANLSQVFIAGVSQVGTSAEHRFLGCSVLIDPFGDCATGPMSADQPDVAYADIDLEACREAQQRSPLVTPRADRRTDVYAITYAGEQL